MTDRIRLIDNVRCEVRLTLPDDVPTLPNSYDKHGRMFQPKRIHVTDYLDQTTKAKIVRHVYVSGLLIRLNGTLGATPGSCGWTDRHHRAAGEGLENMPSWVADLVRYHA